METPQPKTLLTKIAIITIPTRIQKIKEMTHRTKWDHMALLASEEITQLRLLKMTRDQSKKKL